MRAGLAGLEVHWLDTNAYDTWGSADVDATIRRIADGQSRISITRVQSIKQAVEAIEGRNIDFVISNWGIGGTKKLSPWV